MRGCLLIVQPTRRGDREREHGRGECQASESRGWHWFTGVARARRRPRATMILRMTKANSRVLSSLNARLNCSKNRTRARRRPRFRNRKAKRDSNTSVSGHTRSRALVILVTHTLATLPPSQHVHPCVHQRLQAPSYRYPPTHCSGRKLRTDAPHHTGIHYRIQSQHLNQPHQVYFHSFIHSFKIHSHRTSTVRREQIRPMSSRIRPHIGPGVQVYKFVSRLA